MPFDPDLHVYQPRPIDPAKAHVRVRWTPSSDELNVNMIHLQAGEVIGEHENASVDVLLTCLDGSATLTIDRNPVDLLPGVIAIVPRGTTRRLEAGSRGVIYTTCHRKRGGIMPTAQRRD